jgi:hypothetical protein
MAKSWETRTVAEQEAERAAAERKRRVQALEMQRERVLSERTASPHRRSALELALATIENELEQLGWSIKL